MQSLQFLSVSWNSGMTTKNYTISTIVHTSLFWWRQKLGQDSAFQTLMCTQTTKSFLLKCRFWFSGSGLVLRTCIHNNFSAKDYAAGPDIIPWMERVNTRMSKFSTRRFFGSNLNDSEKSNNLPELSQLESSRDRMWTTWSDSRTQTIDHCTLIALYVTKRLRLNLALDSKRKTVQVWNSSLPFLLVWPSILLLIHWQ